MPILTYSDLLSFFLCAPTRRSIPEIVKVTYREPSTTIHWADSTKTTVRCGDGEPFDRYSGFMAAVCKKLFGSTTAAKKIRDRFDSDEIDRIARQAKEKAEAEAERIRTKREKAKLKRRAKQILMERKARMLAKQMITEGAASDPGV